MSRYFRRYYEAADDSGAEPVDEAPVEETTDEAAEAPEEAPAPVAFTPEDIASGLGARYQERFAAHHEPAAALAEYGKSVEHLQSAFGRLSQGGAPTDEDIAAAEALGIDLPQPVEEPVEPLWGAPWAEPTTMEEFEKIASERPWDALAFVDANPGKVNDATRQQVLNYWAEHDRAGAIAYETGRARQQALDDAKAYADQLREEIRQEFGDVRAKHNTDVVEALHNKESLMTTRAKAEIPNFDEYADGVTQLMQENLAQDPEYANKLFNLTVDEQLRHISDLTGVAAWRAQFHAEAAAKTDAAAAEAAKVSAGSERGRGNATSPGEPSQQSAMKKKFTEDMRSVMENPA